MQRVHKYFWLAITIVVLTPQLASVVANKTQKSPFMIIIQY